MIAGHNNGYKESGNKYCGDRHYGIHGDKPNVTENNKDALSPVSRPNSQCFAFSMINAGKLKQKDNKYASTCDTKHLFRTEGTID
jgi:hypothetical protein